MVKAQRIILASQSPRRRSLLADLGIKFEAISLDADESYATDMKAHEVASYLASKKSDAYAHLKENELLITADTTVVLANEVINKPADLFDAIGMLKRLSGNTHTVITGVALRTLNRKTVFSTETKVCFNHLSDSDIETYVHQCRPLDKAGAYGIQDWIGYVGVDKIDGCYYNVMGLPLSELNRRLKSFGIHTRP